MVALFASESSNRKIVGRTKVSATYASIKATCPSACPLRGEGCYAQHGRTALHVQQLDRGAEGVMPEQAARREAVLIRAAFNAGPVPQDGPRGGGRALRLHVSGDARTKRAAAILAAAIDDWHARGGGAAWTYTHAWRTVPRKAWGRTSVLASIESTADVGRVRAQGYVPAIVVEEHQGDRAYERDGVTWIPCPQQTRGIACSDCGLCLDADALAERGAGIAFAAHGPTRIVKRRLAVVKG